MRKYSSNSALAHAFATYKSFDGRSNSMFFVGNTIYSYGYHFPIATRCDDVTFFNASSYSNTTAKHKSIVKSAIAGDKLVECMYVPEVVGLDITHKNNFNYWERRIANLTAEIENPRVRNKATRQAEITRLEANRDAYKKYFNL